MPAKFPSSYNKYVQYAFGVIVRRACPHPPSDNHLLPRLLSAYFRFFLNKRKNVVRIVKQNRLDVLIIHTSPFTLLLRLRRFISYISAPSTGSHSRALLRRVLHFTFKTKSPPKLYRRGTNENIYKERHLPASLPQDHPTTGATTAK